MRTKGDHRSGYSPLIDKHDHLNYHRLGADITDDFPCDWDAKNKDLDLSYISFWVALIHSTTFVIIYVDDTTIYGRTFKTLDGQRMAMHLSFDFAQTT